MTESYTCTPSSPNPDEIGTFSLTYVNAVLDYNTSYYLVNNRLSATISSASTNAISLSNMSSISNALATNSNICILELPNNNILVSSSSPSVPPKYYMIVNPTGTILAYNNDIGASDKLRNIIYLQREGTNVYVQSYPWFSELDPSTTPFAYSGLKTLSVDATYTPIDGTYSPNSNMIYNISGNYVIFYAKFQSSPPKNNFHSFANNGKVMRSISFFNTALDCLIVFRGQGSSIGFSYLIIDNTITPVSTGDITTTFTVPNSGYIRKMTPDRANNILYMLDTNNNIYKTTVTFDKTIKTNDVINPPTFSTITKIYTIPGPTNSSSINYSSLSNRLFAINGDFSIYIINTADLQLNFNNISNHSLLFGINNLQVKLSSDNTNIGNPITVNATCFREGTKILCLNDQHIEEYIPVEQLRKGTLVKTFSQGYKPVYLIGKGELYNPNEQTKTVDRLYKMSKDKYPELIDDLFITGHHSVLIDEVSDELSKKILSEMKDLYETESKCRLPACLDDRFEPYTNPGKETIWHFALENESIYENYGVLANGLLVESCSIRYLNELSNLEFIN
jgi:hypothetical protein